MAKPDKKPFKKPVKWPVAKPDDSEENSGAQVFSISAGAPILSSYITVGGVSYRASSGYGTDTVTWNSEVGGVKEDGPFRWSGVIPDGEYFCNVFMEDFTSWNGNVTVSGSSVVPSEVVPS